MHVEGMGWMVASSMVVLFTAALLCVSCGPEGIQAWFGLKRATLRAWCVRASQSHAMQTTLPLNNADSLLCLEPQLQSQSLSLSLPVPVPSFGALSQVPSLPSSLSPCPCSAAAPLPQQT